MKLKRTLGKDEDQKMEKEKGNKKVYLKIKSIRKGKVKKQ